MINQFSKATIIFLIAIISASCAHNEQGRKIAQENAAGGEVGNPLGTESFIDGNLSSRISKALTKAGLVKSSKLQTQEAVVFCKILSRHDERTVCYFSKGASDDRYTDEGDTIEDADNMSSLLEQAGLVKYRGYQFQKAKILCRLEKLPRTLKLETVCHVNDIFNKEKELDD